jgi:hypothetical protein
MSQLSRRLFSGYSRIGRFAFSWNAGDEPVCSAEVILTNGKFSTLDPSNPNRRRSPSRAGASRRWAPRATSCRRRALRPRCWI